MRQQTLENRQYRQVVNVWSGPLSGDDRSIPDEGSGKLDCC